MVAYRAWLDARCPCGCGQSTDDCLSDDPAEDVGRWQTGYYECGAGYALALAQQRQRDKDEAEAERTGKPVQTGHRLWLVQPRGEENTNGG